MPLRHIPRNTWEGTLRSYGCRPAEGLTALNTAEWWRWPWGGFPFTVPIDDDGYVDEWALTKLIAEMATIAPDGWEFPDL